MIKENFVSIKSLIIQYYPDRTPEIFIVCEDSDVEVYLRNEAEKVKRAIEGLYE